MNLFVSMRWYRYFIFIYGKNQTAKFTSRKNSYHRNILQEELWGYWAFLCIQMKKNVLLFGSLLSAEVEFQLHSFGFLRNPCEWRHDCWKLAQQFQASSTSTKYVFFGSVQPSLNLTTGHTKWKGTIGQMILVMISVKVNYSVKTYFE